MLLVTIGVCLLALAPGALDDDQAVVEAVVNDVYKTISFKPGGSPDWERFRDLFAPGAILTPVRRSGAMSVDEFIAGFEEVTKNPNNPFLQRGFIEQELHAVTEIYSGVAHVFTTYETAYADGKLVSRGINSMQLVKIDGVWLISSIAWDDENSGVKIPAKYLGGK